MRSSSAQFSLLGTPSSSSSLRSTTSAGGGPSILNASYLSLGKQLRFNWSAWKASKKRVSDATTMKKPTVAVTPVGGPSKPIAPSIAAVNSGSSSSGDSQGSANLAPTAITFDSPNLTEVSKKAFLEIRQRRGHAVKGLSTCQEHALPIAMEGHDLIVKAPFSTGKTTLATLIACERMSAIKKDPTSPPLQPHMIGCLLITRRGKRCEDLMRELKPLAKAHGLRVACMYEGKEERTEMPQDMSEWNAGQSTPTSAPGLGQRAGAAAPPTAHETCLDILVTSRTRLHEHIERTPSFVRAIQNNLRLLLLDDADRLCTFKMVKDWSWQTLSDALQGESDRGCQSVSIDENKKEKLLVTKQQSEGYSPQSDSAITLVVGAGRRPQMIALMETCCKRFCDDLAVSPLFQTPIHYLQIVPKGGGLCDLLSSTTAGTKGGSGGGKGGIGGIDAISRGLEPQVTLVSGGGTPSSAATASPHCQQKEHGDDVDKKKIFPIIKSDGLVFTTSQLTAAGVEIKIYARFMGMIQVLVHHILAEIAKAPQDHRLVVVLPSSRFTELLVAIHAKLETRTTILEVHGKKSRAERASAVNTFTRSKTAMTLFTNDNGVVFVDVDCRIVLGCPSDLVSFADVALSASVVAAGAVHHGTQQLQHLQNQLQSKKKQQRITVLLIPAETLVLDKFLETQYDGAKIATRETLPIPYPENKKVTEALGAGGVEERLKHYSYEALLSHIARLRPHFGWSGETMLAEANAFAINAVRCREIPSLDHGSVVRLGLPTGISLVRSIKGSRARSKKGDSDLSDDDRKYLIENNPGGVKKWTPSNLPPTGYSRRKD